MIVIVVTVADLSLEPDEAEEDEEVETAAAPLGAAWDAIEGAALCSKLVWGDVAWNPGHREQVDTEAVVMITSPVAGAREATLACGKSVAAPTRSNARASPPTAPAKNPLLPVILVV